MKRFIYYYSNFTGEANRKEFIIYFVLIDLTSTVTSLYLKDTLSLNDETILNMFYINLILNLTFIPIQAVSSRRLKNIGINKGWIFLNFIPYVKFLFKIYLLVAKPKNKFIT